MHNPARFLWLIAIRTLSRIKARFGLDQTPELYSCDGPKIVVLRWGLLPMWVKTKQIAPCKEIIRPSMLSLTLWSKPGISERFDVKFLAHVSGN